MDFSNDADQLCKFVGAVKKTSGGDSPECYELVLQDAKSLSWTYLASEERATNRVETMKALVIIGDEVPHEGAKANGREWRKELEALKVCLRCASGSHTQRKTNNNLQYALCTQAMGIHVYGVQCGQEPGADEFYRTLAEVSGGHHLRLENIKEMGRLIQGLCYRQATGSKILLLLLFLCKSDEALTNQRVPF